MSTSRSSPLEPPRARYGTSPHTRIARRIADSVGEDPGLDDVGTGLDGLAHERDESVLVGDVVVEAVAALERDRLDHQRQPEVLALRLGGEHVAQARLAHGRVVVGVEQVDQQGGGVEADRPAGRRRRRCRSRRGPATGRGW